MIECPPSVGYVPMRVIAVLDEPIGYLGDLLHLDGPIAYGVYHDLDERTRKSIAPIEATEWPIDLRLPLARWWCAYDDVLHGVVHPRLLKRRNRGARGTAPSLWGWCASAADERAWSLRGKLEIRKRPELGKMARYTSAPSANIKAGHMKAYDLPIPTVFAREVTWHALGDPDKVRTLLSTHVPAIGKKRNIGSGTVREWRVEQLAADAADLWRNRRLPIEHVSEPARLAAIRPPYYHATRYVLSADPSWD